MKIAVITVSDRASARIYSDRSGPAVEEALKGLLPGIEVERRVVPDERERIAEAFALFASADWIITTGGTGPAPRDVTPEATRDYCDRDMPGI